MMYVSTSKKPFGVLRSFVLLLPCRELKEMKEAQRRVLVLMEHITCKYFLLIVLGSVLMK